MAASKRNILVLFWSSGGSGDTSSIFIMIDAWTCNPVVHRTSSGCKNSLKGIWLSSKNTLHLHQHLHDFWTCYGSSSVSESLLWPAVISETEPSLTFIWVKWLFILHMSSVFTSISTNHKIIKHQTWTEYTLNTSNCTSLRTTVLDHILLYESLHGSDHPADIRVQTGLPGWSDNWFISWWTRSRVWTEAGRASQTTR